MTGCVPRLLHLVEGAIATDNGYGQTSSHYTVTHHIHDSPLQRSGVTDHPVCEQSDERAASVPPLWISTEVSIVSSSTASLPKLSETVPISALGNPCDTALLLRLSRGRSDRGLGSCSRRTIARPSKSAEHTVVSERDRYDSWHALHATSNREDQTVSYGLPPRESPPHQFFETRDHAENSLRCAG